MNLASSPNGPATRQRVRLEGILDAVQASDSSFLLRLDDGSTLRGRLVGRPIKGLANLLGRRLLIFGTGRLGASGELEEVEVDSYMPNDGQLWFVNPDELPQSDEVQAEMGKRFKTIIGTWPGDETDEQIEQALREMS